MTTLLEHWELLGTLAARAQLDVRTRDEQIVALKLELEEMHAQMEKMRAQVAPLLPHYARILDAARIAVKEETVTSLIPLRQAIDAFDTAGL